MISSVEDKRMRSAVTRCLSSGKGHFEGDYVTVLGNRSLSLKAYFSSISMADKGTIGGIGIFEDITERKKSEVLISEIMKQEESVSVLGQNALEGIDLDPLLNDAVRIVTNILNVEYCKVLKLLPDKKNMILKAGKGWKKGLVGKATVRGDDNSQAGYTLTTGGPVIVDDLRKDTRFTGPPLLIDHGIVSGISVVIGSIDNPYGVLGAHTSRKRTFKKNDVHFLMSISNVLASAIRRKQNESLLYQSKRDWEETFNAITDMVTVQDRNFNIIYSNKAADKILRLPDLEVTKKVKCFEYYHGTNFPPKACPSCDSYKTGKPSTFSVFEPHLNMYLEIRAMPRLDENYNLTGLIHVVRDITQQRKLEAQLIHAQKMEAIGQLAGGVAHDFNNILTAVIGYSNLLQMKLDKDDVLQHNVKQIISITERGANLTQSLLAFSRKEAIDLKPVSLNKIVETSINVLPKLIGESIEIKKEFLDKRLFIMADSIQIERMIMNFASNARDAMPEGGTISFKTEKVNMDLEYIKAHGFGRQGMYALLSITDTGTGMNEEIKSRIFEPFFTTKKMGEGTGLGLSIVYGIVKQLNGFIIVYSEEGKGTTFSTYFPIIKEGTEDDTEDNIEHPRGDETVLLAEDEDEVRKPLKAILEKFGYNVIEATDGKEAVDKFNKNSDMVKLLIFDMIMPNKNGKTAYADIKLKKPDIKIIFISGYTADAPHIKEMLHEGLPFIAKPVLPRNLLRTMREVLDK
jgi:signal transduction histidine kinase/CheY-like chemotaxis protein